MLKNYLITFVWEQLNIIVHPLISTPHQHMILRAATIIWDSGCLNMDSFLSSEWRTLLLIFTTWHNNMRARAWAREWRFVNVEQHVVSHAPGKAIESHVQRAVYAILLHRNRERRSVTIRTLMRIVDRTSYPVIIIGEQSTR